MNLAGVHVHLCPLRLSTVHKNIVCYCYFCLQFLHLCMLIYWVTVPVISIIIQRLLDIARESLSSF